jgi:2-polyprenyl-3-methyl-5-hydroxy-6-metoxy-1,4-benzoquinol methylase
MVMAYSDDEKEDQAMEERPYVAADAPEESEWERLGLVQTLYDAGTTHQLARLGIRAGWQCLEVGAGRGSIARWLAEAVGPTGHVVAADQDPRFLRRVPLPPNVEIRTLNILTQEVEVQQYDLVACRALLMNVPQPEVALAHMAAAVRPGGWLYIEEFDGRPLSAVDAAYPGAATFDQTIQTCVDALQAAGRLQPIFARRVLALVEQLGFVDTGAIGEVMLGRGGSHPLGRHWSLTFRVPGVERLVEQGVVSREAMEQMRALLDDAGFTFMSTTRFRVWGQRPASGG